MFSGKASIHKYNHEFIVMIIFGMNL